MNISTDYPPLFDAIMAAFPGAREMKPVFCHGDTIYNPLGAKIGLDLIEHERTHSIQQGKWPKRWWSDYLNDPVFRLRQEIEAYGTQYAFIKRNVKDREAVFWALQQMGKALSSPLYALDITTSRAMDEIKKYSETVKLRKI